MLHETAVLHASNLPASRRSFPAWIPGPGRRHGKVAAKTFAYMLHQGKVREVSNRINSLTQNEILPKTVSKAACAGPAGSA